MKSTVHHVGYGQIEYNESFWTGKRSITIDGQALTKKTRNVFILESENGPLECKVKGSALFGCSLCIDNDVITVTEACRWYEAICSLLICIFVLVWGNVPALCEIFPIIGGAIGGAICGCTACANLFLMKQTKNVAVKLLIWLGIFALTIVACFILGVFARAILSV